MKFTKAGKFALMACSAIFATSTNVQAEEPIVRDAEYYLLEAQNAEKWAKDDMKIEKKLETFMKKNGGKAPNIVYILLDDLGFGEIGMPDMDVVRGYSTPHISKFATEGLSLQRMYTEPSCTPTRVAMMTGRHPVRTGMVEAKATISGEGLSGDEVLLPELLLKAGYTTSHVGKWHLGELEQSYANNQGFEHAEFPIHQQGQLAIMHKDSERQHIITGVQHNGAAQTFTLDSSFVADPSDMVTGVEQGKDGKLHEVDLKAGEQWSQAKYRAMNERYQANTIKELRRLAKQDKPFFLNYWPLFPLSFVRENREFKTLNGGTVAETIVECDQWIGDIVNEIDKLGLAENTLVIVMGDNGPFMQYAGPSGQNDRIYRGGKADHLEGGVRVNAYMRWKGVIEPGSRAQDMFHVSDLYTTLARLAGAEKAIPRDRIIDGFDQSGVLLLGETHGRRDYVFVYEGIALKSIVKNKYKMHLPPPGENPIAAKIFDLYRDSREERPIDSIQYGPWAGGQFANIAKRHMMRKMKYPDNKPTYGIPYEGIHNLRPETKKMLQLFKVSMMAPKK
ncbi:sulfatase-like hydrolase/transferase [Lentisphaera marina]|uniref:sulfatase-like hydrolase/transferase n=1 Tax=Lentisphaera marina TaxID=1111041 RepID=UPI00236608F3|nr:sulfatase-like hydrolase/transferase [Lentisphaera marina]MDD7983810.1 sulfatase-like hydrolase/transferase [Lentisphaera marina]